MALGDDVLSLSPPWTRSREVPRQVADEARRRALSAFIAFIIGIVIIIIRSVFENLRLGGPAWAFCHSVFLAWPSRAPVGRDP